VLNENTYIGAMVTSRLGVNGLYNLAYGIDGIFKMFGNDYLDVKLSQSFENDLKNSSVDEPTKIMTFWERRSGKGLGYNLGYSRSGIHYNPGIGFEMIEDYAALRGGIKYGWLPGEAAKLYSHSPEIMVSYLTYIDDGSLMSFNNTIGWSFVTKNQWQGSVNMVYNIENLKDSLEILEDELTIGAGEYKFLNFMGLVSTPATKSFFIMSRIYAGQYFDGSRLSLNMQPMWNISKHMELGAIYNFDRLVFSVRDQKIINHIIGIKATYMLDTRLSVNTYIQFNTDVNEIMTNLRLRYNPKEGNDFYIVFNEGRNTNITREVPNLPVYDVRSVLVKYTYTFSL
jgi:hypothetical protein